MANSQLSSTGTLKRKLAVYTVYGVGVSIIMDFVLPWFDLVQTLGWVLGFVVDYPKATAVPIAFVALLFITAAVDDRFRP